MDLADCLFQWLKTFHLEGSFKELKDLTDGVALSYALIQIDKDHFGSLLENKIEKNCGDSWFFRVSNLRQIYHSIDDFYLEVIERTIPDKFMPNLEAVARDQDVVQLTLLLQLILGCAINCSSKDKHIEVMTYLTNDVKHGLKIAIDGLENFEDSFQIERNVSPVKAHYTNEEFQKLRDALKNITASKDKITEKCLEMEGFVHQLTEEKKALKIENEKLVEKLKVSNLQSAVSANESAFRFDSIEHENLFSRLNNQITALQSDLSKIEEQRDDYRMQLQIKDQEYHRIVLNLEQSQSKLNDFKHDRDELDRLRYLNEEVIKYQNINEAQKKKLEEFVELKRQMKSLEERNASLIKQTCELEEEKKQLAIFKGQVDLLKKQREELRTKAYEESFRADKAEDELKRLHKKFNEILSEKEKILFDLERIRQQESLLGESLDIDIKQEQDRDQNTLESSLNQDYRSSELQERLIRMEFENDKLKKELKSSNDERVKLLESQLEDEHLRLTNYETENRTNKHKIIELEGLLNDYQTNGKMITAKSNNSVSPDVKALKNKIKQLEIDKMALQQTIEKCNTELQDKEQRFQKHLIKAKETYDLLQTHSKLTSSQTNSLSGEQTSGKHSDDVCYWKNLNIKKDEEIDKLRQAIDFREMEERLIAIGFHNMSSNLQRQAAENRIYPDNFTPNTTYLHQQRQVSSQNLMIPRT